MRFGPHARVCLVVAWAASGALAVACGAFSAAEDTAPDDGGTLDGSGADAKGADAEAAPACIIEEAADAADAGTTADCDKTGLDIDLTTADEHCGRCGHDCLGTGCAAGRCLVKEVTSGDHEFTFVTAATSEYLYYSTTDFDNASQLRRLSLNGGSVMTLRALTGAGALNGPRVSGGSLFAVYSPRGVLAFPIDGGAEIPIVDDGNNNVGVLGVDDTNLYWARGNLVLARAHVDGSNAGANFIVHDDPALPLTTAITSDGARVYWAVSKPNGNGGSSASALKIRGTARTASAVTRVSLTATITALAFDVDHIYYATNEGEIWRATKTSATPPELVTRVDATGPRWAKGLAVDETSVYAAMTASAELEDIQLTLVQAPKTCGPPRVLAQSVIVGGGLVSAGKYLYWGADTKVERVVK